MGGPQAEPAQRLNQLLDSIKTEFEAESQRSVDAEGQITRHIQEIELIRGKVYSLEQSHNQMKAKYAAHRPAGARTRSSWRPQPELAASRPIAASAASNWPWT